MLFYNGFIKEIKNLEDKYYELKILYVDGKKRDDFDLYNKNGELTNFELENSEEVELLKALIYSYGLKVYSDINELEPITNNFEVPTVFLITKLLKRLEQKNISIDVHISKLKEEMKKESRSSIFLFFKDLYNYYIDNESITEEYLDMNIIQRGIIEKESYKNLRKVLFKRTAIELILDSETFSELDEIEKKLAKYSILFGSIDNERCREILGEDLKEITKGYYENKSVDEEKIMKVITSINDVYNYFSDKFMKSKNKVVKSFTEAIEDFQALIIKKDDEKNTKEGKNMKNDEKKNKVNKSDIPNFSAKRFDSELEVEEVEKEEIIEETPDKLEILVDSIKSAKESKDEIEENEELHNAIDNLIPASEMIRKMKLKRQQEIISQIKEITDKLKVIIEGNELEIDFEPLEEVVKILEDKGYKIKRTESTLYLYW